MEQSPAQIKALEKLWRFATREPRAHFEDEDTMTFTQAEAQAIWNRIHTDRRECLELEDRLGLRVIALNEVRDALTKLEHSC